MWAYAFRGSVLTLGNNTNNRVESLNRVMKRYKRKTDSSHQCIYTVYKWSAMTSSRKSTEETVIAGRYCECDAPRLIIPLLNMITPFSRTKVLYELENMCFVYVEYENGGWLFIVNCRKHCEVDTSTCECNCRIFVTCRYLCRHQLLAYVKR